MSAREIIGELLGITNLDQEVVFKSKNGDIEFTIDNLRQKDMGSYVDAWLEGSI